MVISLEYGFFLSHKKSVQLFKAILLYNQPSHFAEMKKQETEGQ